MTTIGVTLGNVITGGGSSFTWGPGGTGAGYNYDSNLYVSNIGLSASWEWVGGFGGPHPMTLPSTDPWSITQNGQDAHDAAWGHVRRLESNGFIYWTPNNSVCWRRPPSWPSDCSSAPAGDNPVTDPPHLTGSFDASAGTFTACAWRSDSDSFQNGSMDVTGWLCLTSIDIFQMVKLTSSTVNLPAVKGAIEAIPAIGAAGARDVTNMRLRGKTSATRFVEGGTPTITWYLITASEAVPAVGPYLVYDAGNNLYRTHWRYGAPEAGTASWTVIGSSSLASATTAWYTVSQAAIDAGYDAQITRMTTLGLSTWSTSIGPSHFVVGLLSGTPGHLSDTAPFKDNTNPDGVHLFGFDSGNVVEVEFSVAPVNAQYVYYNEPAAVIGTPCTTVKMGMSTANSSYNSGRVWAIKTSPSGPSFVDELVMTFTGGNTPTMHPIKWSSSPIESGAWRNASGWAHRTPLTSNVLSYDGYSTQTFNASATGSGTYVIRRKAASVYEVWQTSTSSPFGTLLGEYAVDVTADACFVNENIFPGPGHSIVGYAYGTQLARLTFTGSAITHQLVTIPTWAGDPGFPFTDSQLQRISLEPNTSRIWVAAWKRDWARAYSPPTRYYGFNLVAVYDFSTSSWSNVLQQVADYNDWTYMGDDWAGVGFSKDGPYWVSAVTPNAYDGINPPPANDFEKIAAALGEWVVTPLSLTGTSLATAGSSRHLLYRDNGWWGYTAERYGADPWSGGLFTHVPVDMRTFYDSALQELWAGQISALTGSGSVELSSLFVFPEEYRYGELVWAKCAAVLWPFRQRRIKTLHQRQSNGRVWHLDQRQRHEW